MSVHKKHPASDKHPRVFALPPAAHEQLRRPRLLRGRTAVGVLEGVGGGESDGKLIT